MVPPAAVRRWTTGAVGALAIVVPGKGYAIITVVNNARRAAPAVAEDTPGAQR